MNVRRGFKRIFVIFWLVYAAWVVWYPIHENAKNRQQAFDLTGAVYQTCMQARDTTGCWEEYQRGMDRDVQLYRGSIWTESGWHLLWIVPGVLLIPPAIFCGVAWGLVRTGLWVVNGFRHT
jgi:hypothetical protein